MLRRTPLPVLAFASLIFAQPDADARSPIQTSQGSNCNPKAGSTDGVIVDHDQWGVRNTSTAVDASVVCGTQLQLGTNTKVTAVVYDRHSTRDVCCTAVVQDFDGDTLTSAQACTSNSSAVAYTLTMDFPNTDSPVVSMECSIPRRVGNNISHVTSYTVH